jgi:hypothetical protein
MIYSPACGNLREENKIIGHIEHIGAQRRKKGRRFSHGRGQDVYYYNDEM